MAVTMTKSIHTTMKLYYHRTGGGAEYCSTRPEGPDFFSGVVLRADGDEIEVYSSNIIRQGAYSRLTIRTNHPAGRESSRRPALKKQSARVLASCADSKKTLHL